ncbi:MAG: hypothetical protein D6715_05085 [Calditrichaeota bacterium]|nr:MAG: hypothetical protein D6715_05085 [Calditrichota bacterium]
MGRTSGALLWLVLIALLPSGLSRAQNAHACRVQIRDARTGLRLEQAHLSVRPLARSGNGEALPAQVQQQPWPEGVLLELSPGFWEVTAAAEGYRSTTFRLHARPGMPRRIRVFLEAEKGEPVFSHLPGSGEIREDLLLMGCVTDSRTGRPLAGAVVGPGQSPERVQSSRQGFFQLRLAQPSAGLSAHLVLRCEKAGYLPKDVPLNGLGKGQAAWMRIELEPEPGESRPAEAFRPPLLPESATDFPGSPQLPLDLPVLPQTIRVGRQCIGIQCTGVDVFNLETYCKLVLPAEWFPCWGSLPEGTHSLRAGAVAIRTVALWYIYHPIDANYDICDNSSCQVLGNVQTFATDAAVDSTRSWIVVDDQARLFKSEYAAENNNQGCGNGYAGTGSTSACIYDPVCLNQVPNGHGRGMCQWGSVRWATGTVVQTSDPCVLGPAHNFGQLTWQEILTHYYLNSQVVRGITVDILSLAVEPDTVFPGATIRMRFQVHSSHPVGLLAGASVAPAGSGAWLSDPPNDTLWTLQSGDQWVERRFALAVSAAGGLYDVWGALWLDRDGNGQINGGDLRVASLIQSNLFFVQQPTGIFPPPVTASGTTPLKGVFPNPFNSRTRFRLVLPDRQRVRLRLFDVQGRLVRQIYDGYLSAGEHQLALNGDDLASGIYLYLLEVLQAGRPVGRFPGKLVLVR